MRTLVVYPFLCAAYIVANLLESNLGSINPRETLRSLFTLWFGAGMVIVLVYRIFRDWHCSAALATLLMGGLFFYGHFIHLLLGGLEPSKFSESGRWLLIAWSLAVVGVGWVLIRTKQDLAGWSKFLNLLFALALIFPLGSLLSFAVQSSHDPLNRYTLPYTPVTPRQENREFARPDIYFIVVDGYGRQDVLSELYDYDNTGFLRRLESQGFVIARQSRSNYFQTALSIASSLNLDYLDGLAEAAGGSDNRRPLEEMIHHSRVRAYLEGRGYRTIAIDSGYSLTRITDAEIYRSRYNRFNDFEALLVSLTPLNSLAEQLDFGIPLRSYSVHRERLRFAFQQLHDLPLLPGPKFVFVHIVAPHPPFVFDSYGNPIDPPYPYTIDDGNLYPGGKAEYRAGYIAQLAYVNSQLEQAVAAILTLSESSPVILIQGDHGPKMHLDWDSLDQTCIWESASILNAYHLPNGGTESLYPEITPVNSFRLIFNHSVGGDFDFLEDRVFFSDFFNPYEFQEVTDRNEAGCD